MAVNLVEKKVEELVLLLMYLTSWEEECLYYDEDNNLNKNKYKNTYLGCSDLERGKDSHYSYIKVIQNIISH